MPRPVRLVAAGIFLALATRLVAAVPQAQSPEPASLLPKPTPIFLEARDASALALLMKRNTVVTESRRIDPLFRKMLEGLASGATGRLTVGIAPSIVRRHRWVVIVESSDHEAALASIRQWSSEPWVSGTIRGLLVLADGEETLEETAALAEGKGEALTERPDFKGFRSAEPAGAPIGFHVDLQEMWPRAIRQVRNGSNLWPVLFACHVNHVMKTLTTLSGHVTTGGVVSASMLGEIKATDSRAVTEGNPHDGVIAPPPGTGLRVSMPRNLSNLWSRRRQLLPEALGTRLEKLDANVAAAAPGWTVEKILEPLGEAFDLYIAPRESAAESGRRVPAMGLVAVWADPDGGRDLGALKMLVRMLDPALNDEEAPLAPAERISCHRGVQVSVLRSDPLVIARVRDRVIVANDEGFARTLIDQALDHPLVARQPGDEIVVTGPAAAAVIRDAKAILASGWLAERLGEPRTRAFVESIEAVLHHARQARIAFDLDGKASRLEVVLDAPELWALPAAAPK